MRWTVAIAIVLAAGTAAAQPAPAAPAVPAPAAQTMQPPEALSEATSVWLGLGATAGAWSLFTVGAATNRPGWALAGFFGSLLTPGAGHLYAGSFDGRGFGLRLGGLGFFVLSVVMAIHCEEGNCGSGVPFSVGAAFYLWGTLDSIATAPRAVRRHNARPPSPVIVPVVEPDRTGFVLGGQF
jgi:hypothetical protein